MADRINKLREMFNKAGEGKTKLSVNDFSRSTNSGGLQTLTDSCQGCCACACRSARGQLGMDGRCHQAVSHFHFTECNR